MFDLKLPFCFFLWWIRKAFCVVLFSHIHQEIFILSTITLPNLYVMWCIHWSSLKNTWSNAQVSESCTSANVIFCITCTYCKKLYIGETRRRRGDRFQEHLRDVGRNDKDASKPVARHLSLPNDSPNSALLIPTVSTSAFRSTNLFSCHHISTNSVAPFSAYKPTHNPQFLQSLWRRANAPNVSLKTLCGD